MIMNMIAMLPPDSRPKLDELEEEPAKKDFMEDVDDDLYMGEAWSYVRKLGYLVEECVAKYVANIQSRRSMA